MTDWGAELVEKTPRMKARMTTFVPLTPADIPEVMRLERLPGYDAFVGRFEAEEHAAQFASDETRYFGERSATGLAGFVIMQEIRQPSVLLRRIAVGEPERGVGTRLVRAALDWTFLATKAEEMRLDVARGNPRARHVYEREGLTWDSADEVHDYLSIPRARWAQMRGR